MADEKQNLIRKNFRRASLTIAGVEQIEAGRIGGILGQMGQPYDEAKLNAAIKKLDPKNTGFLDHDAYNKICEEFVKDPAALAKFDAGDEFAFKQLITLSDLEVKK